MEKKELIEKFQALPTGNIMDAMAKLGIRRGVVLGLDAYSPTQRKLVGFAKTIKQMQRHQTSGDSGLATHSKVIDNDLSFGDVLVIDVDGRKDVCTGGAILALRAKLRGAAGYLINGCLRDRQEIIDLDFPVFACGAVPVKSSPDLETVGIDIPVEIGGVQIRPGDLIVGDDTGVVVVPKEAAPDVIKCAEEIKAKEEKVTELVQQGSSFAEACKAAGL